MDSQDLQELKEVVELISRARKLVAGFRKRLHAPIDRQESLDLIGRAGSAADDLTMELTETEMYEL